jgi:hypothetical protein
MATSVFRDLTGPLNYELVAAELIRSVRGSKRSQAAFSRRIGYRSNIVNRWESQQAFPTASRFLEVVAKARPGRTSPLLLFLPRAPAALAGHPVTSVEAVAAFLNELRGKTPLLSVARDSGFNRYSVSRWLSGQAEPKLPQFLCLIEVMSRRLLDFLACCADPLTMSSVAASYRRLELLRETAYEVPWSHAVLRALELEQRGRASQMAWLMDRLGASRVELVGALGVLEKTGQIAKVRGRYRARRVLSVNTAQDRVRAHGVKVSWTQTALERMRGGAPGNYGYSVFAASKSDLRRLRDVHLEYVRAMQQIIAESAPGECVGLYCAQLLDLGVSENALADGPASCAAGRSGDASRRSPTAQLERVSSR